MKKFLGFALILTMVFAMAIPAAAGNSVVSLYSVANKWYYDSTAQGVLTVKDNHAEYTFAIEKGANFLGTQSGFFGQLRFVSFNPNSFRHIVVWDFKQGLSEEDKDSLFNKMKEDLENLADSINGITELRVMRDAFNPGLNNEGQIVLDAIFESQEIYAVYAFHPEHLRIAEYVRNDIIENRRVANFFQTDATRHADKYRHIVIWEFQDGLDEKEKNFQFNRMKNDLEALVGVIPGLVELNVFRDPVNLDGNGQVVLIALFNSRADHLLYGPHPEHQRIAAYVVAEIVDNMTRRQANFYE